MVNLARKNTWQIEKRIVPRFIVFFVQKIFYNVEIFHSSIYCVIESLISDQYPHWAGAVRSRKLRMGFDEFGWKLIVFETVYCNSSIIRLFLFRVSKCKQFVQNNIVQLNVGTRNPKQHSLKRVNNNTQKFQSTRFMNLKGDGEFIEMHLADRHFAFCH